MSVVDLKNCTFSILDGLSGTATGPATAPTMGATSLMISATVLNTKVTAQVPVGARFTIAGETAVSGAAPIHTVTARTPTTGATTSITFSPSLGAGTYTASPTITFQSQKLDVKIGTGNLTYSEKQKVEYILDRGLLETARLGDQEPMDVNMDAMLEHVISGTSESITPVEAIKGIGAASEFVSTASDKCEPYAIDLQVLNALTCGGVQQENFLFPDFRYDQIDYDFNKGTIAFKGKCNATEPTITRI